ncbi:hypothetical protein Acy02nite_75020 [Actinoplanes cyaneus]|uniref:Uncharacterized protein n=1 Tax=Actinoplanes cyaneus TaxID=52696 RepID=A0A919MFW2_9ACTN|nr:DUF6346 domain-containing protein [Actinoplanes cyaneus]MCW2142947.1 hypothetical protein [Actinoplanes cyaneus]GID69621.1 hypothetical protein Acy02nite_75020 [Actinoplanes cyaneus]
MTSDTNNGDRSRGFEARERSAWQRRGSVGWRLVKLAQGFGGLVLAYATMLVGTTLLSFYSGTYSIGATGPAERSIRATVQSCERVGPVSDMGLGYWWVCHIRVATTDRGDVEAVVDRSIVSKEDVGRSVDLREACGDKPGDTCTYGKAAGAGWQLYAAGIRLVGPFLIFLMLAAVCFYFLAAVLGAPRYLVVIRWWQRKVARSSND